MDGQRVDLQSARCELKTSEEIHGNVTGIGPQDGNNDHKLGGVDREELTNREECAYDNRNDHYNPLTAIVRGAFGNTFEQKRQTQIGAASGEGNMNKGKLVK